GRLDHEDFLAADVLLDLDLDLAVGEGGDQGLARADAQLAADAVGQRPVRVAAEDEQVAVFLHRLHPGGGSRICWWTGVVYKPQSMRRLASKPRGRGCVTLAGAAGF